MRRSTILSAFAVFSFFILGFLGSGQAREKPPTAICSDTQNQPIAASKILFAAGSNDARGRVDFDLTGLVDPPHRCIVTFSQFSGDVVCVAISDVAPLNAGATTLNGQASYIFQVASPTGFMTSFTYMCDEL